MRASMLLPLVLFAARAVAADGEQPVEISLSSFKYTPATVTLDHGRPYLLRLTSRSGGGHNFVAREFFAATTLSPADRAAVHGGGVEVHGGETVALHLVAPAPGHYRVRCTHFLHASFGMTGEIVVR